MRRSRIGIGLAVAVALAFHALPAAAATLIATYQAAPPATAGAGTALQLPVTITNAGTDSWNAAGPNPVNLSYHWSDLTGRAVIWDGARTPIGSDIPAGGARQLTAAITVPDQPGLYQLQLALVKEGVAWLNPSAAFPLQATPAFNETWGGVQLPALLNATTYTVNVPISNSGVAPWNATGVNLVDLSYHWTSSAGQVVVWDGVRTAFAADVPAGGSTTVAAKVTTPAAADTYTLTFDLVREGVAWFGSLGATPLQIRTTVAPALYAAGYSISATAQALLGESRAVAITVTNRGNVPWLVSGPNPINLSYHVYATNGNVVIWDGGRTGLGSDLQPGESRSINVVYTAPTTIGSYTLAIDTVREGVTWLSQIGSPSVTTPLIVTSGFNGGYDQTNTPGVATVGASLLLSVRVSNYGARAWPAGGSNPVRLSYHLLTTGGGIINWDGQRGLLAGDLAVGQSAMVQVPVTLPSSVGSYVIAWDLVQEGVAWFSSLGVARLQETISVQPGVTFYG